MQSLLLVLFFTSCATLFSTSTQRITFTSEPSGATVYLNENAIGKTPLDHTLDRDTFKQWEVRVTKKGYEDQRYQISKTLNGVAILNLTSLLSWATDMTSGNMIEYSPNKYYSELKKASAHQFKSNEALKYVHIHQDNIVREISTGGEHLTAYATLLEKDPQSLRQKMDKEFLSLLNKKYPTEFHAYVLTL